MLWNDFVKKVADGYGLEDDCREVFLTRIAETNRKRSLDNLILENDIAFSEATINRRMREVYQIIAPSCPKLARATGPTRYKTLLKWLEQHYRKGTFPKFQAPANPNQLSKLNLPQIPSDPYIEPDILEYCCNEILKPGCLIRIKAPWRFGKTELLSRVVNFARGDFRTAIVNLRDAEPEDFQNLDCFLRWFCAYITTSIIEDIPDGDPVAEHWSRSLGNPKIRCKTYFEKYLLSDESPLVVAWDEVERIFPYGTIASEFLGMLRTRHEDAKTQAIWGKLHQILAYTEDYCEMDINQSPFNAGIPIQLPELQVEQVHQLAQKYQLDWSDREVKMLMKIVGGHPYLVHEAIKQVEQRSISLNELIEIVPRRYGIYSDFLQRYGNRLRKESALNNAFRKVVRSELPVNLLSDLADKLYQLGLIELKMNEALPRYNLYRQYFRDRLVELK